MMNTDNEKSHMEFQVMMSLLAMSRYSLGALGIKAPKLIKISLGSWE